MFSNVWPFFVRCWHVLTTKSIVVAAFKKRLTNTAELKEWERLECYICCFPKQKLFFTVWATFFCHRSCTGFTILFKDIWVGWHSLPQGLKPLCTTVAEEQPLSAHPATFMFQTHIQGQGNQMESHQQNRGSTSVAGMFPRQVSPHLSPAVVSSHSFTAMGCRRDSECPLDAAIKFHFAIILTKVSLNPSQR